MSILSRFAAVSAALLLGGAGPTLSLAQQPGRQAMPARPGEVVEGMIHREGDERYRLAFASSGAAMVEVSGAPADCALQVGSQGFQESDSSPSDWTDGQPGQAVRHSFRVQAGRPGTIWVLLRSRASGVSGGRWSAVACSNNGPYYVTPDRGAPAGGAPATFEGRPVQPSIPFRLMAQVEGAPAAAPSTTLSRGWPGSPGGSRSLREERAGFSLDYPEDWSAAPPEKGTSTLRGRAGTPAGEAVVTVTVVSKATVPNSSDMQILLRMHERLTDMGADLAKLGPATVGGQRAAFASHVYDDRNSQGKTVPFDHVQLVLDHGTNYYLIAFVAPHEVFVQQTAAFKRIFTSWRFLP
jgi:hypothetical protein